jgi:hypothetical protein
MKILFEEYQYNTKSLQPVIGERYYLPINAIYSKIQYVGYYFNPKADNGKGDVVIIFPKVFINKDLKAFDEFSPEELINPTQEIIDRLKISGKDKIIFEISTWLFRAIQQYNKRHLFNSISENQSINQVISNLDDKSNTELEINTSLFKFYKENQNLFTFIAKTSHSQQHKINWSKTINKKKPFIQNNQPFYIEVHSKKKKINEEEELVVLFYSTLNYIKDKYAFDLQLPQQYDLIKGSQFETMLRRGCRYLKSIKYKYYSDKMIALYNLLYTYFERSESIQSKKQIEEILLIKDFNIVFEDMIDDLISDTNLLKGLKNHPDGKQLDHIYKYKSLILDDSIYFVGDSKYYQPNTAVGTNSKAKQFTYAKNVIQHNIKLFNENKLDDSLRYRENSTEGYNITPNFFISAFVNNEFDFSKSHLKDNGKTISQYHFENRLFDRDTLFIQSYDINFLFVLSAYISRNSTLKANFKKDTQKHFRNKLVEYIDDNYDFYIAKPKSPLKSDEFIVKHFKLLNGKIYKPSQLEEDLIFAFEKKYNNDDIIDKVKVDSSSFEAYKIGNNKI